MPGATFARPDPTTFCRLDERGFEVTAQRLEPDRAVLVCGLVHWTASTFARKESAPSSPRSS